MDLGATDLRPRPPSFGEWVPLVAGIEFARMGDLDGVARSGCAMRVSAGSQMLNHSPLSITELLVVEGALECDGIRHDAGDFLTFDDGVQSVLSASCGTGFSVLATTRSAIAGPA